MIYNFLKERVDKSTFCHNVMPYRSYFVPCSNQAICDSKSYEHIRQNSDRVFSLSGPADFALFGNTDPMSINSQTAFKDKINIGESWESQSICDTLYNDTSFYKKSHSIAGVKNTIGVYRRFFEVSELFRTYYLSFLRVGGSFEVYINGNYIGFSDIGRGEFDISKALLLGTNELVVKVKKYSDASFVSIDSGFSQTGITGDVLLFICNKTSLFDYHFSSRVSEIGSCGELNLTFNEDAKADVNVQLFANGEQVYAKRKAITLGKADFSIEGDFELYSADSPILYDLYIKVLEDNCVSECTKIKVSFGNFDIADGIATFSNFPLKIYGVNYNGCFDHNGKDLTINDIKKDLMLIKLHNFNTIATTSVLDPIILEYCHEIGLYVVETIDINTFVPKVKDKNRDKIINDNKFLSAVMEKTASLFHRNKSNTNILFYSFGMENGDSIAIKQAVEYIKSFGNKLCVYDNANTENADIVTIFHPDINELELLLSSGGVAKPVFMPQYGMSSGAGCASIREFIEVVDNSPSCLGGCIMQFCDDATIKMIVNDNGIFNANRHPYLAAQSHKYICRSIHASLPNDSTLELRNKSYFASTENIATELEVISNGKVMSKMRIEGKILPRQSRKFEVFLGHLENDMYLNIYYIDKLTSQQIGSEQIVLNNSLNSLGIQTIDTKLQVVELFNFLEVRFEGGFVKFNKQTGTITSYNLMGKELIKPTAERKQSHSFVSNIYRPFVRNIVAKNTPLTLQSTTFNCEYDNRNMSNSVSVEIESVFYRQRKEMFIVQDKYIVNSNGVIEAFSVVTPMRRGLDAMDCFGKQIKLHNNFGYINYYGRGKEENYIDVFQHAFMGLYNSTVDEHSKNYTLLQESGNHTDVHYAVITDSDGDGLAIVAKQSPFQLRVSPHSDREIVDSYLFKTKLSQSGVYVDINAFVSGIGNTIDGKPLAQYMIKPMEYILHFDIVPVYNKKDVID